MVDLARTFASLEPPPAMESYLRFSALPVPGLSDYRIAVDPAGQPSLLISTAGSEDFRGPPLVLEHLSIQYAVDCRISEPGRGAETQRFTIIRCTDTDADLRDHFLAVGGALIEMIGIQPSPSAIRAAIGRIVELFRALQSPGRKSVLGFWGELFLISRASDIPTLVRAWHITPEERFDLSLGSQRLEVKSAGGRQRFHHFGLEQVLPISGTQVFIASLLLERSAAGPSVADLLTRIRSGVRHDPEQILNVDRAVALTLGAGWRRALDERFDDHLAAASLAFFDPVVIPKPATMLPPEVTHVRFRSDLSRCTEIAPEALRQHGELFRAALPRR